MAAPSGGFRALAIELAIIAAISAALLAAYFYYGRVRWQLLIERDHRILEALSEQLSDRVDGRREAITTNNRLKEASPGSSAAQHLEENLALPDLTKDPRDGITVILQIFDDDLPPRLWFRYLTTDDTSLELPPESIQSPATAQASCMDSVYDEQLRCESNLSDFVHEVLDGSDSHIFDAVLLSTKKGRVLYQERTEGIVYINDLYDASAERNSQGITFQSGGMAATLTVKKAETDGRHDHSEQTGPGQAGAGQQDDMHSSIPWHEGPVRYQGEAYWLMTVPAFKADVVHVTPKHAGPGSDAKPEQLLLSALVRESTFDAEVYRIPPSALIALLFALLLCLLLWPLLRLWFMKPGERLRARDARLLVLCFFGVAAALAVIILHATFVEVLSLKFDRELRAMAKALNQRFVNELCMTSKWLLQAPKPGETITGDEAFDLERMSQYTVSESQGSLSIDTWPVEFDIQGLFEHPKIGIEIPNRLENQKPYTGATDDKKLRPYIPGFFVDGGKLYADVTHRSYFRDAEARNFWQAPRCDTLRPRYAGEVVLAKNTGEYALILAAPDQRSKSGDPPIWIADAKLSPFINATVPLGFGFAIVDAKGLVQMHSITNRSLQENLFRECDEDPELRGAIFSRRSEWLTVRYYGDDYRMHTLPIEGTPFSTVAFYDIRVFQAACSGILSAWLWSSLFVRASVLLMSSDRRNSDARIQCEMAVAEP